MTESSQPIIVTEDLGADLYQRISCFFVFFFFFFFFFFLITANNFWQYRKRSVRKIDNYLEISRLVFCTELIPNLGLINVFLQLCAYYFEKKNFFGTSSLAR